ncbi:MAG: DUF202 domain-containing protein [Tannerellaceae bacterium]|nr:DUF202 domain-containing protein [Tannerellaceae bacterium]
MRFFDDFDNKEQLILRDHLALERTKLANERTLFSYIRISLYLLTVGIGILQIKDISHLVILAWISIAVGVGLFIIGVVRYIQMNKHLKTYMVKETGIKQKQD